MASCPKCGAIKIKKRARDAIRFCRRCGALPGPDKDRAGIQRPRQENQNGKA